LAPEMYRSTGDVQERRFSRTEIHMIDSGVVGFPSDRLRINCPPLALRPPLAHRTCSAIAVPAHVLSHSGTKHNPRSTCSRTCADCTTPRTMYSDRRRLRSQGSRWYARTCRWSTSSGSGWLWHQPSRRRILCTSGPRRTCNRCTILRTAGQERCRGRPRTHHTLLHGRMSTGCTK